VSRFSEFEHTEPLPPLFDYDTVKEWFGLTEVTPDVKVLAAMGAVSKAIRDYTGCVLTKGEFTETFDDVVFEYEKDGVRYLRETPIDMLEPPTMDNGLGAQSLEVLNAKTGKVRLHGSPQVIVNYTAGYDPIPEDLLIVYMELIRLQMAQLGESSFGNSTTVAPQEKAVWVGTLKVEYAVSPTSQATQSATAGGISQAALAPWAGVLDNYRSRVKLVAT